VIARVHCHLPRVCARALRRAFAATARRLILRSASRRDEERHNRIEPNKPNDYAALRRKRSRWRGNKAATVTLAFPQNTHIFSTCRNFYNLSHNILTVV